MTAWLIMFLVLANLGTGWLAGYSLRRASRRVDQILVDELGHRGAHATYDAEMRAWREAPRD